MRARLPLAALVLLLAASLLLLLLRTDEEGPPPPEDPCRREAAAPPVQDGLASPEPAPPAPASAPAPGRRVRVETNVPGAEITLEIELFGGEPDPEPIAATADANGDADLTLPELSEPIAYVFARATAPGFVSVRKVLNLAAGRVGLDLRPGFPVRGQVLARGEGPVEGAAVEIGTRAVTDAYGAFVAYGHREGETRAVVTHPAYRTLATTVHLPADGLEFVLDRGLSVRGRVTFADGTPLEGVRVQDDLGGKSAVTGPDGSYELTGLEDRTVGVFCPLYGGKRDVPAGSTDVDFVLPHHVVRFHVKDEHGRPFRRAHLRFTVLPKGTHFT